MDLKFLFIILFYYGVLSVMFIASDGFLNQEGYTAEIRLDDSSLTSPEIDKGGLFGTGVSFGRFIAFITMGIGLPSDTPIMFAVIVALWQSIVSIMSIGFVISSIWNG